MDDDKFNKLTQELLNVLKSYGFNPEINKYQLTKQDDFIYYSTMLDPTNNMFLSIQVKD